MKKFVVLLVVVAMSCFSAVAFAADISVSGSIDIRSRDFNDTSMGKDLPADTAGNERDTQERVRLTVDAKAGDVKGRISIENDWDSWGRLERKQADASTATDESAGTATSLGHSILDLREAWINFNIPGIPVNVNVGHQLLQLGNGWFLRNMKYGDDAWVVANVTGANTVAFVDAKVSEGDTFAADDIDFYSLLDVFKLSDTMAVGIDLSSINDRRAGLTSLAPNGNTPPEASSALGRVLTTGLGAPFAVGDPNPFKSTNLQNIGLNFNGAFGPVNLKAEVDFQMGKAESALGGPDVKFKGNQIVITGNVAMDPVTINATLARGSGLKSGDSDIKQMVTVLDADQHYTLLYEYKIATPALNIPSTHPETDNLHTGFANTTALNIGVSAAATKSLNVGIDGWYLQATEKVFNAAGEETDKIGTEIDAHLNWAMYDNLSWNWQIGYFMPGDMYKNTAGQDADASTGIEGILSYKF
jgi:hypothetical protein